MSIACYHRDKASKKLNIYVRCSLLYLEYRTQTIFKPCFKKVRRKKIISCIDEVPLSLLANRSYSLLNGHIKNNMYILSERGRYKLAAKRANKTRILILSVM